MDEIGFIGENSREDVEWLCSLSESELDLLISFKMLARQRAKAMGQEQQADNKFNLKTLRALGFILMRHMKRQVQDLQLEGLIGYEDKLDECNLLYLNMEDNIRLRTDEDPTIFTDEQKRSSSQSSEVSPDLAHDRKRHKHD